MGLASKLAQPFRALGILAAFVAYLVRFAFSREMQLEAAMEEEGEDGPTVRRLLKRA